ncbi:MAG: 2-C-methyl-D-erythritol 4-phosphate cytidylyltransferase, partial [Aestuariivirgaceae bacterium]|nr:2-C-methyl-D-erythritol 4-phosphate cytidylyltransferase [Aestuariivirgaceae bacterium]
MFRRQFRGVFGCGQPQISGPAKGLLALGPCGLLNRAQVIQEVFALGTAVLILAAGAGIRAGGERPKQYQPVGGHSVLRLTVEAFLSHPGISHVQVVIGEGHEGLYAEALQGLSALPPVQGGLTRQESALKGLEALAALSPTKVLIHDAAR